LFKDGGVQAGDGTAIKGDTPFAPEVYLNDEFHPICFTNDDERIAAAVCEAAGFPYGGSFIKKSDGVYGKDALLVPPPLVPFLPSPLSVSSQ
jgi:hypothetical protein